MDQVEIIEQVVRRVLPVEIQHGIVFSIKGAEVLVHIAGSRRPTQAYYAPDVHPSEGDTCVLIRTARAAPWVLIAAYPNPNSGYGSGVRPPDAGAMNATRNSNIIDTSINGSTNSTINYNEIGRAEIQTRGGGLLCVFSGYMFFNGTAEGFHRLALDGATLRTGRHTVNSSHPNQTIAVIGAENSVRPGSHVVTFEAYHATNAVTYTGGLTVAELA